jgi:hypothetical protein
LCHNVIYRLLFQFGKLNCRAAWFSCCQFHLCIRFGFWMTTLVPKVLAQLFLHRWPTWEIKIRISISYHVNPQGFMDVWAVCSSASCTWNR